MKGPLGLVAVCNWISNIKGSAKEKMHLISLVRLIFQGLQEDYCQRYNTQHIDKVGFRKNLALKFLYYIIRMYY